MYQIKCDNDILHDVRDDTLTLHNPRLNLEANSAGTLSFTIYPQHPYFDKIKKLQSIITVYKNGKLEFKGRVMDDKQGFDNEKQVECEGKLAFFNDSIMRPFDFKGTPAELFTKIVNNHNEQVADFQKFKIGKIRVVDSNDLVVRSLDARTITWEILKTRCFESALGGYLSIRYEPDGDYLDWVSDFPHLSTQSIIFGQNLLDLSKETSAEETYTAMIPEGAEIGGKTVSIASVNGGKDYLINEEMAKEYGTIFAPPDVSKWSDVTLPANLLTKAKDYLNNIGTKLRETLEISAIDLNLTDEEIEAFNFCEYINVLSKPHGISEQYLLKKMDIDIAEPQNTRITLGETRLTITDFQKKELKKTDDIKNRVAIIENDYVTSGNITEVTEGIVDEKVSAVMGDYVNMNGLSAGENVTIVIEESKVVKISATVPKKVSELQNDSELQSKQEVIALINASLPESGVDGFSPTVAEKTKTDSEYVLTITDTNGSYDTPNLKGANGADGIQGIAGTSATIQVGSVTTGESTASVVNSGTEQNAIFDFVIPKGAKGEVGSGGSGSSGSPIFTFEIGSDGHLYLYYDTETPPNMYIDASGHLIYEIGE